eukprot:TRINITY_DN18466_c1_g2_i1.p2 TRINITY_DN18466_c1_g2~~TRINITY_DN18466_c1_g2_i1.p2  ORF type:complete len:135 (+),score=30.36 TRINITY_DN18466_c1_g2_i1:384-788(+)
MFGWPQVFTPAAFLGESQPEWWKKDVWTLHSELQPRGSLAAKLADVPSAGAFARRRATVDAEDATWPPAAAAPTCAGGGGGRGKGAQKRPASGKGRGWGAKRARTSWDAAAAASNEAWAADPWCDAWADAWAWG